MKERKKFFMSKAIELSEENVKAGRGGPFGAIIAKKGAIIATAANLVTILNDPTAHAEIVAIRKAANELRTFDLKGCELYASCEPCPMCLGAIYWARLDRIYFAANKEDAAEVEFDDHFIYQELQKKLKERSIPSAQLLRKQALYALQLWKEKTSKVKY